MYHIHVVQSRRATNLSGLVHRSARIVGSLYDIRMLDFIQDNI